MHLPVAVKRAGGERIHVPHSGYTQNISSVGVLFTSEQEPDLGVPIEYVITLPSVASRRVNIRCIGKVVRCVREDDPEAPAYRVAATLERYEFVRSS